MHIYIYEFIYTLFTLRTTYEYFSYACTQGTPGHRHAPLTTNTSFSESEMRIRNIELSLISQGML